jgi:L-lactate dehydrogenase complex protein LldG
MSTRDDTLIRLRTILSRPDLRFPPPDPPRLTNRERMTVTQADGDRWDLAARFGQELAALHGSWELVDSPAEGRLALIAHMKIWLDEEMAMRKTAAPPPGDINSVLCWAPHLLPIPELEPALADTGFRLFEPKDLSDRTVRDQARSVRFGLSSVDAAFAATGTVMVASGPGKSRSASLLPLRHIVLVPLSRLYPTAEAWLAERRYVGDLLSFVRESANIALISGPSKSADIESNLTLGVHGPKQVHAILFDDIEALVQGR